mgnify:FL=1
MGAGTKIKKESFSHAVRPKTEKGRSKSLMAQNYRLAIRMEDEQGWYWPNTIIWHKPNAMPSSVKDRFSVDYEPMFFFTKSEKHYFEQQFEPANVRENEYRRTLRRKNAEHYNLKTPYRGNFPKSTGDPTRRNMRSVWRISTKSYTGPHSAVFPPDLIITPIRAGCPRGGIVLDPFMGSGTTALVAKMLGRNYIGIEINPKDIKTAEDRLRQETLFYYENRTKT